MGIVTVFIEDGQTKTDRAIYLLGYSAHPRVLRADKVELEGLSLRAPRRRRRRAGRGRRRLDAPEPAAGRSLRSAGAPDVKREVEALARVQPWVAERRVRVVELSLGEVVAAAEALGDVVAGDLEVHAAGPGALGVVDGEEALDLGDDVGELAGLPAAAGRERVPVHRVAHPDDGVPRVADGAHDRRQRLADLLRAHARDEREPAGDPLRVQRVAQRERVRRPSSSGRA